MQGAIRLREQAQFDALAFIRGLAKVITRDDRGLIFEKTRVMDISEPIMGAKHVLKTNLDHTVRATDVGVWSRSTRS